MHSLRAAILACLATIGSPILAGSAEANTIYTYSFVQEGYQGTVGITAALTGTFSATKAIDGSIQQADLIDFSYNFRTFAQNYTVLFPVDLTGDLSDLTNFSYLPYSTGSTLFLTAQHPNFGGLDYGLCLNAAAAFGLCGGSGGSYTGAFTYGLGSTPPQILSTSDVELALLSVTTTPVATTPIPPTLPLFASAIGGLGLFGRRKTRLRTRQYYPWRALG